MVDKLKVVVAEREDVHGVDVAAVGDVAGGVVDDDGEVVLLEIVVGNGEETVLGLEQLDELVGCENSWAGCNFHSGCSDKVIGAGMWRLADLSAEADVVLRAV